MITLLHLSDIHMGSGFAHGRLNPETGLNTRLEDFIAALTRCIDRALAEPVDLVLFGGDAFPDATPPPLVQQALARQFCRLSAAGIPTVLLVGNHDQHAQGLGGASLSIYRTLGVPDVVVGDRLETHRIDTRNGPVQVVTLPWLTKSTLLTRPETEGFSMAQVNELLLDRLRVALEGEIRRLDPDIPAVLLAHAMVDTATYGAERFLATGRGFNIPMAMLARPCFDYVALGHVHRYQVLCEQPLMIYPGSIERVDFSEEAEEKGYLLVQVSKENTQAKFCPLPVRPFKTIQVNLTEAEHPQARLERAIAKADITNAVVRCLYTLRTDQVDQVDQSALETILANAHTYTLQPELKAQTNRSRLPELGTDSALDPLSALGTYLANRDDLSDLAEAMMSAAAALIADETEVDLPPEPADIDLDDLDSLVLEETAQQLRLL
ncbi:MULTISPECIES: exonuclease subunit SbcD [Cyanophyceae]|uniref:Nuclease SbcCD subunit D n=1 Tax=Leptolyngbya subtilissima DQ-A4 TaxID=2933933 RepID=A0ABV0K0R0_9CYAN|nr:exonuclease subunit SbcD [Nodosilinea sp. FACHB-141]MBD2111133.1 exonuclease subunit SbcD [Nodosilinea sp. FACHB-141]